MAALSRKLRNWVAPDSKGVMFWCPGCDEPHSIRTEGPGSWQWDGNVDEPTFSPSIRTFTNYDENGRLPDGQTRTLCHSFVRAGRIEFLADSVHALAGQTVDLPDWPKGYD